ncbi:MAG: hypothetical protein WCJ37_02965 [Syntrophus sp. (in: bacteria)]
MSKNMDTIMVSGASGVASGSVAYVSAVKSMGFISTLLWKAGVPMVAMMSGPAIVATAAAGAMLGGSAYFIGKAFVSRTAKLENIAHKYDFEDGPQ